MNLTQLLNSIIPLTGADYESDIVRHLNKGLLNLAQESSAVIRANSITAADGTVAVPESCLYIKGVYQDNVELPRYHDDNLADNAQGVASRCWVKDGDDIVIIPNPGANKAIQVAYVKKPAPLVNPEDTPEIDNADEYLIAYAVWRTRVESLGAIDDTTMYWRDIAMSEFRDWVNLNKKQEKRPRFVRYRPYY